MTTSFIHNKQQIVRSLLVVVVGLLCCTASPALAQPAGYNLVFEDQFSGTNINTSDWTVRVNDINTEINVVADQTNSLARLHLTTETIGVHKEHQAAFLRSKDTYVGGYFTARIRNNNPLGQGVNKAFWLISQQNGANAAPNPSNPALWASDGAEVDIFEQHPGLGGDVNNTVHWAGYDADQHTAAVVPDTNLDFSDWHEYSLLWDSTGMEFFVDGSSVSKIAVGDPSIQFPADSVLDFTGPSLVQLSVGPTSAFGQTIQSDYGDLATGAYFMEVDFVQVYQLGAAAAAIVPEPTAIVLVLTGTSLLLLRRKRF